MLRVTHLRDLALTCRNLARQLPPEKASELEALAGSYEEQAQRRLERLVAGAPLATDNHPANPRRNH